MNNAGGQGNRARKARSSPSGGANINSRYRGKEPVRGPAPPNRPPLEAAGVYADPKYAHVLSSVIGVPVQVMTTAQQKFDGVLESVSSDNETVLGMANLVDKEDPKRIDPAEVKDKLIFKSGQIVYMVAPNVDMEYAAKSGFQTDSAISGKTNGTAGPRELQPWVEDDDLPSDHSLSLDSSQNGWDARDMFEANQRKFQVGSSYDDTLSGYTTPLQQASRDQEAHAARIADEIERGGRNRDRADQNGDEETAFAAVKRPGQGSSAAGGSGASSRPDRYIPPARRQNSRDPPPAPRMSAPPQRTTPPAGRGRSGPPSGPLLSRGGPSHSRPGPGGRGGHTRASPPSHQQPTNGAHPVRVNGDDHHQHASRPDQRGDVRITDHRDRGDRGDHRDEHRAAAAEQHDRHEHRGDARGDHRSEHARAEQKTPRTTEPPRAAERDATATASPSPSPVSAKPPPAAAARTATTPAAAAEEGSRPRADQRPQSAQGSSPAATAANSTAKSGVIAGLKEFRSNFVLSEESAAGREEQPSSQHAPRKTPTPTKSTDTSTAAGAAPAAAAAAAAPETGAASGREAKPPAAEATVEKATATLAKSKLNPNAKAFTPSQPSSLPNVGYSPAPTPPARAVTPQTPQVVPCQFQSLLTPTGPHPAPFGYLQMGAQPFSMPQQQQHQPSQQPPRMQKQRGDYSQMGGMPARAEASPMQVAAVTGQPLMAPSPMAAAAAAAAAQGAAPHLSMQMPQPGLMPPQHQYPAQPQMFVRMMPAGMYPPQQSVQQPMQQQQPPHHHQQPQQQPGHYEGQQYAPPPPAQLAAHVLMPPSAGQPGPPQPATPGPAPPPQSIMYPMSAGGGGGAAGPGPGAPVPYPPNSMYVVSAAGQQQMQAAQFAMLQSPQLAAAAAAAAAAGGPAAAVMTSQAASMQPQQYYIPQPPHPHHHHSQQYGPGGVHPMSLVPNPGPHPHQQ